MKETFSASNLFYDLRGSRWVIKEFPLSIEDFVICLRETSSLCPLDEETDFQRVHDLYNSYKSCWEIQNKFPIYKRSRGSLFFNFTRSNASRNFYLDRCYLENSADAQLSKRQNTVSLDSFVSKYGLEIGHSKFQAYVQKWKVSISKHDKKELYKNWKNSPESYFSKINPNTGFSYTLDEAKSKIKQDLARGFKRVWEEYRRGEREKSILNTTLEYYFNKGLTLEEATIALKERQSTFSLEKCIQKHGPERGLEVFKKRQDKWMKTLDDKTPEEKRRILLSKTRGLPRFSRESKDFFDAVVAEVEKEPERSLSDLEIYYGKNEMILWDRERKKPYFYDFSIPFLKLIIEYNGSAFHPNVNLLSFEELQKWICPFTKQRAPEKSKRDEEKINLAKSLGYEVLVVWDTDSFEYKLKNSVDLIKKKLNLK